MYQALRPEVFERYTLEGLAKAQQDRGGGLAYRLSRLIVEALQPHRVRRTTALAAVVVFTEVVGPPLPDNRPPCQLPEPTQAVDQPNGPLPSPPLGDEAEHNMPNGLRPQTYPLTCFKEVADAPQSGVPQIEEPTGIEPVVPLLGGELPRRLPKDRGRQRGERGAYRLAALLPPGCPYTRVALPYLAPSITLLV